MQRRQGREWREQINQKWEDRETGRRLEKSAQLRTGIQPMQREISSGPPSHPCTGMTIETNQLPPPPLPIQLGEVVPSPPPPPVEQQTRTIEEMHQDYRYWAPQPKSAPDHLRKAEENPPHRVRLGDSGEGTERQPFDQTLEWQPRWSRREGEDERV